MKSASQMFSSYLMGGYECTYAHREDGSKLDLLAATKHDLYCREDYQLLKDVGIKTVREGLAWSDIDKGENVYDFARFEKMMRIAKEEGIQQIWDLNHFDYPCYLDAFTEKFVTQFAEYARRVITLIRKYQTGTIYIVPVNEMSYFSYKAADKGDWAPFTKGRGNDFKAQLVRANIAAMNAIRSVDHDVRFIQVDPIFYRTPKPPLSPGKLELSNGFKEARYMSWDMLTGKRSPELGGDPKYLDIIGANYYILNQEWIVGTDFLSRSSYETIPWDHHDRISLADMLSDVYQRYNRPIVITETGGYQCPSELKGPWWKRTFEQVNAAVNQGVPVEGICAYPILDMYDWHDAHLIHPGIWDFQDDDPELTRIPHTQSIAVIKAYTPYDK
jgi:beta-glucosidase/6-phospho-beta-glucosidase/beta-galactosidase